MINPDLLSRKVALKSITCYFFLMDSLLLLVRFFIGDAEPEIQILNELYCAVLEEKSKKQKRHYHDIVALHFGLFLDQFLAIHFQTETKEQNDN